MFDEFDPSMESFTASARHAIIRAVGLANDSGSTEVSPSHVVLAILDGPTNLATIALAECGIGRDSLAALGEVRMARQDIQTGNTPAYLGDSTRALMLEAVSEAKRLGHHYVNPEHLFLAALGGGYLRVGNAHEIRKLILEGFGLADEE